LHARNRKTLSRIKSTYGTRADRFIFKEEKIQFRRGALSAKNVEEVERGERLFSILWGLALKEEKMSARQEKSN